MALVVETHQSDQHNKGEKETKIAQRKQSGEDKEKNTEILSAEIFEKYLTKKLTWTVIFLGLICVVAICTAQALRNVEGTLVMVLVGAVLMYFIGACSSIRSLYKPSYSKLVYSVVFQAGSLGVHLGFIAFVLTPSILELEHFLPKCNCVDDHGKIVKNGTDTWDLECNSRNPLPCGTELERHEATKGIKTCLLWSMLGSAGLQCLWSLIQCGISVLTLVQVVWDFEKIAASNGPTTSELSNENVKCCKDILLRISWIQMGFELVIILVCVATGYDTAGMQYLFPLCALRSYCLISWTFRRQSLGFWGFTELGVFHAINFGTMYGAFCFSFGNFGNLIVIPFSMFEIGFSVVAVMFACGGNFQVGQRLLESVDLTDKANS